MKILVLGVTGTLVSYVINALLKDLRTTLVLYARNIQKLIHLQGKRIDIIRADMLYGADLKSALKGVYAIYAGLNGELENIANTLVRVMNNIRAKNLVWISSYGIYNEAGREVALPPNCIKSAQIIENLHLDYTIIRSQWFSDIDEMDYDITHRYEGFKNINAKISRKLAINLVRRCLFNDFRVRDSPSINKKGLAFA